MKHNHYNNTNKHRVFNQLGSLKNVSDNKKAEIWMTYRMKMKEQFSLHRSSVTVNLKAVFLKGASREVLCLLLKYIHYHANITYHLLLHKQFIIRFEAGFDGTTR